MLKLTHGRLAVGIAGLAGALLLLSACGSSAAPAAKEAPSMHMAVGTASPAEPAASNAVSITNFAFQPATITVHVGTTVTWTNDDTVQHTVSDPQDGVSSPALDQNETFSHTFTAAGTYHYICTIHPFMHGSVVVTG